MLRAHAIQRELQRARIHYTGSDRVIHILCPFHADSATPSLAIYPSAKPSYYCFGCLDERELVWTDKGLERIGSVSAGDFVLTHRGQYHEVLATDVKWSDDNVQINLHSFHPPLTLTADHTCLRIPVAVAKTLSYVGRQKDLSGLRYQKQRRDRIKLAERISDLTWLLKYGAYSGLETCRADEICSGDFICFPVIPLHDRLLSPLVPDAEVIKPYTKGPRTPRLSALPVTERLAWLYGLYLAEGSLRRDVVVLTCHLNEHNTLLRYAATIAREELGLHSILTPYPKKNTSELYICKTDLVAHLRYWFGSGATGKRVPGRALTWPPSVQRALIAGYLAGDGDSNRVAETVSKQLAYGLYGLAIQCGYCPTIYDSRPPSVKDGVHRRRAWRIRIGTAEALHAAFCSIDGLQYYVTQVRDSRPATRSRRVVDLSVAGDESFVTKIGAVHNCHAKGPWADLAAALKVSRDIEIAVDDRSNSRLLRQLRRMVDTKPMLPPGISPWNLGPWRGFEVETLAAVHSLWWFDEASRARRVLWPIWGRDESLVGWTSRLLDKVEDAPKYRNLPRMAALQTMWPVPTRNLESLDRSLCVIVEGIPDAIRLLALGVPTLSNLGTAWSHTRTAMLADLGFREVIVSCDGDAAGRKANLHIGYELRKAIGEKRVTVWEWSDSVDPGDAPEVEIDALLAELKLPKRPHPWLRCLPPLLPEWSL